MNPTENDTRKSVEDATKVSVWAHHGGFIALIAALSFVVPLISRSTSNVHNTTHTTASDLDVQDIITRTFEKKETETQISNISPSGHHRDECRIYMAPSSLGGVEGFGLYTTSDYEQGDLILNGPDGPGIPVINPSYGSHNDDEYARYARDQWVKLWDNYWWGRGVPDHVRYEAENVFDFQILFGSLPNHHCVLDSLNHVLPDPPYVDSILNRTKDPGAGAVSYHKGRNFYSMRHLRGGDEIFLNYGYCNDLEKDHYPSWTNNIPMYDDFQQAQHTAIELYMRWKTNEHLRSDESSSSMDQAFQQMYRNLMDETTISDKARVLVPESLSDLVQVIEKGQSGHLMQNIARTMGTTKRQVDWIREKGFCVETLIPGRSTVPQAGHGAFAQWNITKGDVIVPVPLLQIPERESLRMFDENGVFTGLTQLLMNYCFGHKESSLLLCPTTNAILINHCSKRSNECGPNGANAEYRWATTWDKETERWLNMTINDILDQESRGLSLEIVALRDISAGEEVFIDYGEEWELQWKEHIENWRPKFSVEFQDDDDVDHDSVFSTTELNENHEIPTEFVSGDLRQVVEHSTIFTGCMYWTTDDDMDPSYEIDDEDWEEYSDEEILLWYSDEGSEFVGFYSEHEEGAYWPCSIISSEDEYGSYFTVRIHQSPFGDIQLWEQSGKPRLLTGFPRASIRFFYHRESSDTFLPNTFRHFIPIRDEIFPEIWKNRKSEDSRD